MANPLQPKVIKCLEEEFNAHVINIVNTSKSGNPDLIACINGLFYGFEIKWKNDKPSELQKEKINRIIAKGGKAYFIRSVADLRNIIINNIKPEFYEMSIKYSL